MATTASTATSRSTAWAGWIGFAGWIMIIIGALDFFEGLIAIIRDQYYVLGANQIIVFDLTTWGWVTLVWGIIIAFAGFGLLTGASWARWFAASLARGRPGPTIGWR